MTSRLGRIIDALADPLSLFRPKPEPWTCTYCGTPDRRYHDPDCPLYDRFVEAERD